jgi:hypothetical protein
MRGDTPSNIGKRAQLRIVEGYKEALEFAVAVAVLKVMKFGSHEIPTVGEVEGLASMKRP